MLLFSVYVRQLPEDFQAPNQKNPETADENVKC
ncbi:hypothetical protein METHPM2_720027 [Pseudomonas sp. PM2]